MNGSVGETISDVLQARIGGEPIVDQDIVHRRADRRPEVGLRRQAEAQAALRVHDPVFDPERFDEMLDQAMRVGLDPLAVFGHGIGAHHPVRVPVAQDAGTTIAARVAGTPRFRQEVEDAPIIEDGVNIGVDYGPSFSHRVCLLSQSVVSFCCVGRIPRHARHS